MWEEGLAQEKKTKHIYISENSCQYLSITTRAKHFLSMITKTETFVTFIGCSYAFQNSGDHNILMLEIAFVSCFVTRVVSFSAAIVEENIFFMVRDLSQAVYKGL